MPRLPGDPGGGPTVKPKRPARKAKPTTKNAPHNVQTPPGGDIASSGGDYGTHAAKRHTASHAFRKSVRQTYAAQTPARRKQVSAGAKHQPGPAAAAIRHEHGARVTANRRAAGTDTPRGNIPGFGQVQQQRRTQTLVKQILQAHRDTPISSTGDTKSDLELGTAEAFKATPQFASDFNAAVSAGRSNLPKVPGAGIAAAQAPTGAAKVIDEALGKTIKSSFPAAAAAFSAAVNVTSTGRKALGPGYPAGYKNIPLNLVKQALDMPAQAVPSIEHGIIEPIVKGDIKTAASNALGVPTYKAILSHPERELQEHPLTTGLAVAAPLKGVSNIARAGAVRTGAIPPLRPEKTFPNSALTSPPKPVARGIVGATVQTLKDRPIRQGKKPPEVMTSKDVRRAAFEHEASSEVRRRHERQAIAMTGRAAIGKNVTPGHILGVQNYVKTIGDVREYLGQVKGHQERDKRAHAELQKSTPKKQRLEHRAEIKQREQTIDSLEKFLDRKDIKNLRNEAELPEHMQGPIEAYKAVNASVQKELGSLYGEEGRIEMRGLLPYAQKRMGATHVKSGFVDNETGRLIPKEEANALRRELPKEDFEARVQKVNNVWQADNKIITAEDIKTHQKLEGPKIPTEVAAEGELSIRQRELDQIRREVGDRSEADIPSGLYKKLTDKHAEVEALKHRIEVEKGNRSNTITPAAYISHAPNRKSAAAYFVATNRPQRIAPTGYTGRALDEGLLSLHKDVPIEDLVKSQGLVSAIKQYGRMVRDISIRKDAVSEDVEGLVDNPAHPEVATFKDKTSAARVAADFNVANPDHPVVPYRISFTKGAQETILGDESDVQAGLRAENAMINALNGTAIEGGGHWALGPKDFLETSESYLREKRPVSRMVGSQFRRTVLALSIPWMVGNFGEAALRSAIERAGLRSHATGKHILNYLKENDPEAYHYLVGAATGGGHFGLRRTTGLYTSSEHLIGHHNAGVRALGDAIMRLKTNPVTKHPAALIGGVWDKWTDFVFDTVNGPIESQFQTAMMGKAFRENLMPTTLRKLSKKAMNEAIEGKLNPRTMDMLGREVDRMYGKYSKFSPGMKAMIAHTTPFIAWYLNAVKFIYHTMPKHHPLATSIINNADAATREWRKDKGLGLFLEGHAPYFLQGAVPTKGGFLRAASRYTPFGLMGDPYGVLPGIVFPQAKTVILNMMGIDWKGDKIPGYDENGIVGYTEALKTITAQLIPGYTIARKAATAQEGESLTRHIRRTVGDPFMTTQTPQQTKAAGGEGSSDNPYKSSKPSSSGSSGSSSDNPYKKSRKKTTTSGSSSNPYK